MKKLSKKLSILLTLAIMLTGVFGMPVAAAEELTEAEYDDDSQTFSSLDELDAVEGFVTYDTEGSRKDNTLDTGFSLDDGKSNFIFMPLEDSEGQRVIVDGSGVNLGSFTNVLNTSNPYDIILFTTPIAQVMFANLSSVNSNYVAQLGFVDSTGAVMVYSAANASISPGQYAQWTLAATDASRPYNAVVIQSYGTLGDQYTFKWNKTVNRADMSDRLYVSLDLLDVVTLVTGNNYIAINGVSTIYLGNGGTAPGDGSTQLEWGGGWNITIGGVGYNRRDINIYDVHINRANLTYASSIIMEYTKNAPGSAYSSLAIALELDMNTYYHTFRSSYTQATGNHWYNQDDYLGIPTARYLFTGAIPIENMSTDKHYVIVDIDTGIPIDLYGNHNMFYSVDGYQLPTIVNLPKATLKVFP